MLRIFISIITFASFCLLVILLNTTTPTTAGPIGILAIFILAYLLAVGLLAYLLHYLSLLSVRLFASFFHKKSIKILTFKSSYYYATIIAAAPIILVGLQSVGKVGFYEFLLTVVFIVLGCLYVSRKIN